DAAGATEPAMPIAASASMPSIRTDLMLPPSSDDLARTSIGAVVRGRKPVVIPVTKAVRECGPTVLAVAPPAEPRLTHASAGFKPPSAHGSREFARVTQREANTWADGGHGNRTAERTRFFPRITRLRAPPP